MTFTDINIAIRREGEVQRLPEKPLSFSFIPISPVSPDTKGHEKLALGTYLLHGGAIRVADPDVVLRVDGHTVGLLLMANDVIADGAYHLVILVELKQLRFSDGIALKDPKLALRGDAHR